MADQDRSSRAPSHSHPNPDPFGYTIVPPPEADMASSLQANPILDDSLRDHLNDFFDSPDNNASAILQNPAMTAFINTSDFNFDLNPAPYHSLNSPWQFHPPSFDHDTTTTTSSAFTDQYGHGLHRVNSNGNSNGNPGASSMPNYSQLDHSASAAASQPPRHVLSDFGLGDDTPEDVVQAATKLFAYTSQKQASTRQSLPSQSTDIGSQSVFRQPLPLHDRRPSDLFPSHTAASPQTYSGAHYTTPNGHFRTSLDTSAAYNPASDLTFAPHRNSYPSAQPYQFGSDSNFDQNGYSGPYQSMNEQRHIEFARGMAPVRLGDSSVASAASSHPQSPVASRQDSQYQPQHIYPYHPVKQEAQFEAFDPPANPAKRRRTIVASAEGGDTRYIPYSENSPAVNRQPSSDVNNASPVANSASIPDDDDLDEDVPNNLRKRRKSSSAAQAKASAAARKNLTEEQKRENHIKSEQKRRNIIKDGYKNLNELVPNLKQGGFSKSATLTETVRELETLQQANEIARLRIMEKLGISPIDLDDMMHDS